MSSTQSTLHQRAAPREVKAQLGFTLLAAMLLALFLSELPPLWHVWRTDPTLSHGPLVPVITGVMLWLRRDRLKEWNAASIPGMLMLALLVVVHVASVWADIEFIKPISLIGVAVAAAWYLGGRSILKQVAGPLGFLCFMVPWPTTLVTRVAFPLQILSSTYAAMCAGILGVPVVRDGVHLAILPNPHAPPTFYVVVAAACSGLTSITVLLALGYLVAQFTRTHLIWKVLMCMSVVPLALVSNTLRITFVLAAAFYVSQSLAHWVHDHESPVLIFFCSLMLMGIRQLLQRAHDKKTFADSEGGPDAEISPANG